MKAKFRKPVQGLASAYEVVRGIHKAGKDCGPPFGETLTPVQVGNAKPLVAEGRFEETGVTEVEPESARGNLRVLVPMLDRICLPLTLG